MFRQRGCHHQKAFHVQGREAQEDNAYLSLLLLLLCSKILPEDGTPVPKYVGVCYLSLIVFNYVPLSVDVACDL